MKNWRPLLGLSITGLMLLGSTSVFTTTTVSYDWGAVGTLGNHSYVSINQNWRPGDKPWEILKLLNAFEESHPDLAVDGWAIEKPNSSDIYTYGLWINHHPRKLVAEKTSQ